MRIAVMGAGAVGCFYGGMLGRAGHGVTLVGRPVHVDAVRARGLDLETKSFRENVPMAAATGADGIEGAELVLFCVKSADSEKAAAEMKPHLESGAIILSLQNGVDNAARAQAVLEREVIPAVVYVAVEMAGPGHVRHHGRGELVIGESPRSREIVEAFARAGIEVAVSANVVGELWAKLIVNCAYNALSAVSRLPYGRLVEGAGVKAVMRDVVEECLAVAKADAIAVPGEPWQTVERIARTMPGQFSSTAQDLMRGKPTEIDHLNGFVVRRGDALGVPTPSNRVLHSLVKLLEENR